MNPLADQAARDRFVQVHGRNISVIAPAGVGKTTAIVQRIVQLARLPEDEAVDRLTRLVVVTYSVRAAQQMQQKARVGIREARVPARVQRAFQQTFFGTIHSYCVRLLDRFGHYLGLPSPVGLVQEDEELWNRFLVRGLPADLARGTGELLAFYTPDKLYQLGRELAPGLVIDPGALPALDFQRVLDYEPAGLHAATARSIRNAQERLRIWAEGWQRGERHRVLPKPPDSEKAVDFIARWEAAFAPLHAWVRAAGLAYGRRIANAYEAFRLAEAVMTYDDQVRLALRVLENPQAREEIAAERNSVLLDEAQDTDPRQFDVLRRVAGLGAGEGQAGDQSFAIVGDFQQAIYAPRSDLRRYREVHEEISIGPRGMSSVFQVTFRCDTAIIDLVNRVFPSVLDDALGQSRFEPLMARADAGPGQVVRWLCPVDVETNAEGKITPEARADGEARFVARRLHELGPAGLGARDWAQVAILCPRIKWLAELQRELLALGLPVQMHASGDADGESLAAKWLTALVWIAAHPEDTFEIAGVLREILGVSDAAMARYTGGDGDKLRLDRPSFAGGPAVEAALDVLREACARVEELPLAQAVRQLVEKTQLRERLHAVAEAGIVDHELDDALALVAARAAEGATLAELAQELRAGLGQAKPGEEEIRDAIQLMTSYKAKGLEWQAVIVPFVFRVIGSRTPTYPRVDAGPHGEEILSRDGRDFASQVGEFVTRRERQQFQRLLYVVATRAKRTLVWIDDEQLYDGQERRNWLSAADYLGFGAGGANRGHWDALTELTSLPAEPAAPEVTPADEAAQPAITRETLQCAVANAQAIPRRVTPHALAVHPRGDAEPEELAEQEDDVDVAAGPGILYGTWWHEFVQAIPWERPRAEWEQLFARVRATSPDPRRAAKEWKLFLASELAAWLAEPGRLVQVEWPFLFPGAQAGCLEGVMDLAVFSPGEGTWHVIDWKTNRVGPQGAAGVVEIYRGQIRAYVEALRGMLGAEVKGSLYLTQTGAWAPVD
ncbi:MAG TPA: UvrD-helicase domain-containing protein [Candidatus Methylacidiphilales bacterium]|jgi:ATP-dependent exoDNAse (exonuclease V) beta subunit|nr:UvrD-helicase domain-containing protein [Candidatus Methylacidiphilales bacterium]